MKKRVWSLLMVLVLMSSLLSTAAFATEDTGHDCVFATEWSTDAEAHWYACTVDGCEATDKYAAHADTTTVDGKCDTCGYVMHEHIWSATDYGYNSTHHWNICKGTSTCYVTDPTAMHGYTTHVWTVDSSNTDTTKTVYQCVCGASYDEHAHIWATTLSSDDNGHWYACTNGACDEQKDYTVHNWVKQDTSTSTQYDYKCSGCGATKSDHVHVWSTSYTWDGTYHWHTCVDSSCRATSTKETHYDYNGTGVCDAGDCSAPVSATTLSSMTITGLTEPAEGASVGFTASVAETSLYGTPTVKWNRVTNLSTNTSVALGSGATFAAGYMYNTSITIPINSLDSVSSTINITLNGQKVPFYTSTTAFNSAVAAYEGNHTAYMAKEFWSGGSHYIQVCAMYAKLDGTHTCVYGSDWTENATQHYYLCTGCGGTKSAENHYDNNSSGLCDVCGYEMSKVTSTTTHTHSYSSDWVESATQHWYQCTTCGATKDVANHADLNNTGLCDVCGFVMTAAEGHTHTFSTDWTETFAQHYKVCSCGAKTEIAAHYDNNNTGLCDICGYAMTTTYTGGVVDTGDGNATALWIAAVLVSMMGLTTAVVYTKKRRAE